MTNFGTLGLLNFLIFLLYIFRLLNLRMLKLGTFSIFEYLVTRFDKFVARPNAQMPKFSNTKICSFLNAEIFELPTFYTFQRWNSQTQRCSSLWDVECANSRTLKFSNVEIFVRSNPRIFKWLRNIEVAELELYYFRNNRPVEAQS